MLARPQVGLSKELKAEFPGMQGFSERNLYNIKSFYLFYNQDNKFLQQLVAEIRPQLGDELQTSEIKTNIIRQKPVDGFPIKMDKKR
ncbi:MAG: DUF1016 N-terminal domain-containing protein [Dysgonamonadaceae bacterium]|jgi:hypothetical protein|nr:DUF1016 N-terminal domain-containing protein [Dysgonamonadaceae bacterium]